MSKKIASTERRGVLKTMSKAGVGLALAPYVNIFQGSTEKKLGVALVGLGNYATRQLGPALKQTVHCELRGIVTGSPEKIKPWQTEYGIAKEHVYNYETFDQIADDPEIDIVYIVLPNFMHAEYSIRALKAGKHVICEKPMGMNSKECVAMIQAAKSMNKKLQVGYRLFYEPHHLKLMQVSQQVPEKGIKLIEASLGFEMARPGSWRIDKDMGGGGALMDLGIYTIQATRRAAGSLPIAVSARGFIDNPDLFKGIYGTYLYQLEFEKKVLCNSTVSFSAYSDRLHVSRANDFLAIHPAFAANKITGISTWNDQKETLPMPEFQQSTQMDAFAKNILENTPIIASGEEGLIDMDIIGAIKRSIDSGKVETIEYTEMK